MRSSLLDIQLTPNNRPPPSTTVIRMHIQPGDGLRRGQHDRQLQLCVPLVNLDGESYRLRDHHAAADTLRRAATGTRQPLH
jgi:hypothetical protein